MREKINRLATSDIDIENPELLIAPEFIEEKIKISAINKVEINIDTKNNIKVKALLYSSNYRVRVLTPAIGGLKNRIILEVDTLYLDVGDTIDGELSVITNASEFVIPYRFTTFSNKTSGILNELKSINDFLLIYREDREAALKIFEFKDFIVAPFMSYFKYRSLYENLIQRNNKKNSLEEFFVCLDIKKRIDIFFEKEFYNLGNVTKDTDLDIYIKKINYGYFELAVSCDEDFVKVTKNNISDEDFKDDILTYKIIILEDKLKYKSNSANITFSNAYINKTIQIKVENGNISDSSKNNRDLKEYIKDKKKFLSYIQYRLKYEYADDETKEILPELMRLELEEISSNYDSFIMINLLSAEAYFLNKQYDKALDIIDLVKDDIEESESLEYIFMEYMLSYIDDNNEKRQRLIYLLEDMEGLNNKSLSLFALKLDDKFKNLPILKYEYLLKQFESGNKSPYLYIEYIKLLDENPAFLHDIGKFELLSILYGVKKDFISNNLNKVLRQRINSLPTNTKLSYYLLISLYKKYQEDELLAAICRFIIRADIRNKKINKWLRLAIDKNITINLLYEYYIYSLGESYNHLLDDKIFEYFKKNNFLDLKYKALLYRNLLEFSDESDEIYCKNIKDMEKFALSSLKMARIDENLAYIYNKIIKEEMMDYDLAKFVPAILKSYQIKTKNNLIKSVVILYPELKKEFVYNIDNNKAYIPIFSNDAIILECDYYGNRYANFDLELKKAVSLDDILKRCYELDSSHPILKLEFIKKILDKELINDKEVEYLEEILKSVELSDSFKNYIFSKLVYYYRNLGKQASGVDVWESRKHDILIKSNKDNLDSISKAMLADAFISMGYFEEAYNMLKKYKCFNLSIKNINTLVERMILSKTFKSDYLLLYLSYLSFSVGNRSNIVLDYLCEYYNNDSKSMYDLLEVAIIENIETYDLEERLLSQLLFSSNHILLDQVFAWYVSRKKSSEILVRAYFSVKSIDYILYDMDILDIFIEYLENAIIKEKNVENIPIMYKLAMLKYYSALDNLDNTRKEYAKILLNNLLIHGLELPFYKNLSKFFDLPNNIEDKQILLYIANNKELPYLYSRTLRDEEFKKEEFNNIYRNMYTKSKMLFDDEEWEYKIVDQNDNLLTEGIIKNIGDKKHIFSRFALINDIINQKNEEKLYILMEDFIFKDIFTDKIFTLM